MARPRAGVATVNVYLSPAKNDSVTDQTWLDEWCGSFGPCAFLIHEEGGMTWGLSSNEIRDLGFDWPKYALIEEYCVIEAGKVDLAATIEGMQSSQAYYKRQLDEAFAFKTRHRADYSDFTDRFDDYARMHRELGTAIAYVEEIIEAAKGLVP